MMRNYSLGELEQPWGNSTPPAELCDILQRPKCIHLWISSQHHFQQDWFPDDSLCPVCELPSPKLSDQRVDCSVLASLARSDVHTTSNSLKFGLHIQCTHHIQLPEIWIAHSVYTPPPTAWSLDCTFSLSPTTLNWTVISLWNMNWILYVSWQQNNDLFDIFIKQPPRDLLSSVNPVLLGEEAVLHCSIVRILNWLHYAWSILLWTAGCQTLWTYTHYCRGTIQTT